MVETLKDFEIANTYSEEERDRIDSLFDKTVDDSMKEITTQVSKEQLRDALTDMLAHELVYMASWDSSSDLAKKFLKSLTETEVSRLTSIIAYEVSKNGLNAIDYRALKRPFILDMITEMTNEKKKLKNERYCPNCGKKTDADKTQCIHCYSYLSNEPKQSNVLKKLLGKIYKKKEE